jgi:hypothetical protein
MNELFEAGEELLALLEEPTPDWEYLTLGLARRRSALGSLSMDGLSESQAYVLQLQDQKLRQVCQQKLDQAGLRIKWTPHQVGLSPRFVDRMG